MTADATAPARILMVDDYAANLLALEAILEPLGVPLVKALSGEEALLRLLEGDFSVILLDVQMPGLNGLETAELIKKRERSRDIPIILITAMSREAAHIFQGYQHGAVDYLLKPVDPEILRAKVKVFVDLYRRGETIRQQAKLLGQTEAREAFLAVVAHEMRTPLTAAKAQAQLALRQLPEAESSASRRTLSLISRQIDRLVKLVGDLLEIDALEDGRLALDLREFDLAPLLPEAIERLGPLSPGVSVAIESPEPLRISADRDRIEQVITNLLANAVRYSPAGGRILLAARSEGTHLHLSVTDQGLGVAKDKHALIFERFGRAHSARYGGLGLGLSITKGIVEQHGGKVWVESDPEKGPGSTFHVILPRRVKPTNGEERHAAGLEMS
jgi:signal transduction histidine kinase